MINPSIDLDLLSLSAYNLPACLIPYYAEDQVLKKDLTGAGTTMVIRSGGNKILYPKTTSCGVLTVLDCLVAL